MHPVVTPGRRVVANPSLPKIPQDAFLSPLIPTCYTGTCPVKRRGALLRSNPTRDSRVRAGRISASPVITRWQGSFFSPSILFGSSEFCARERKYFSVNKFRKPWKVAPISPFRLRPRIGPHPFSWGRCEGEGGRGGPLLPSPSGGPKSYPKTSERPRAR